VSFWASEKNGNSYNYSARNSNEVGRCWQWGGTEVSLMSASLGHGPQNLGWIKLHRGLQRDLRASFIITSNNALNKRAFLYLAYRHEYTRLIKMCDNMKYLLISPQSLLSTFQLQVLRINPHLLQNLPKAPSPRINPYLRRTHPHLP
jgi:hypothetical protein